MTDELEFLIDIVKQSSKLINKDFVTKAKDNNNDLITDLDTKVEKFLIEKIKERYPSFEIISEEFNKDNKKCENYFTIDPIDGTINFAHGLPLWGIQVAMVEKYKTVASVILLPEFNDIFYADKTGAYKNGEILNLTSAKQDSLLVDYIYLKNEVGFCDELTKTVPPELKGRAFRKLYCAAAVFSWIADNKLSGYVFTSDKAWDYTPGMFLVKQAGGSTEEIVFNNKSYWLAGYNKETLDCLISAIKNSQGK